MQRLDIKIINKLLFITFVNGSAKVRGDSIHIHTSVGIVVIKPHKNTYDVHYRDRPKVTGNLDDSTKSLAIRYLTRKESKDLV
jgi:hypothetical protein